MENYLQDFNLYFAEDPISEDDYTAIGYMTEEGDLCLPCVDKVYGDNNNIAQECEPLTKGTDGKSGVTCHHCRKEMLKVYQEVI